MGASAAAEPGTRGPSAVRILIVTGIFPPDIGGPASYTPTIARELVARGHEVTVVTYADSLRPLADYGFRVARVSRRLPPALRAALAVWRILREGWRSDVWLVTGLALQASLANLVARRPMVQKVVGDLAWERACHHDRLSATFEEFQRERYGAGIERSKRLRSWWTRQSDIVVVPSRYLVPHVAAWGVPPSRIRVIHNAVEVPASIRPAEVPIPTPLRVVTVGRLIALKQVARILGVLPELPGVGLVVVGDGPERSALDSRARALGVEDRVWFCGARSRPEALAIMAAADLFVLNSIHEGFPHALAEAMALGLPVIATDVGGNPELVQDGVNGRLIPPQDDAALRDALRRLGESSEERRRLAAAARSSVSGLRPERMAAETVAVLEEVVAGAAGTS